MYPHTTPLRHVAPGAALQRMVKDSTLGSAGGNTEHQGTTACQQPPLLATELHRLGVENGVNLGILG